MNFHREGQIVEINIPHLDKDQVRIEPTEISAVVRDGDGLVLETFDVVPTGESSKVVIPGVLNDIQSDAPKDVREVIVTLTHAGGVAVFEHYYGIEAEQSLRPFENSFQTYPQALLTASNLVNANAFVGASPERQRAALSEAFAKISRMNLVCGEKGSMDTLATVYYLNWTTWPLMTAVEFQQLPAGFRQALLSAQVLEADELLQGNVMAKKHAQGIASETIGESSVTLRAGFSGGSVQGGLSHAAMSALAAYVNHRVEIARA